MRSTWLWIGFLIAAPVVYNLDAIAGQWKFNRMCKAEGGSRFLASVEKDVGWEVAAHDTYSYQGPFAFGHVTFVRYENKQGVRSDVRESTNAKSHRYEYTFTPADESVPVRYRFLYNHARLSDDDRFTKTEWQVVDLRSGEVVASHTRFGYEWTKPERTLLAAPTGVSCWDQQEDLDRFHRGLYTRETTP
jgi:hypothetical protein